MSHGQRAGGPGDTPAAGRGPRLIPVPRVPGDAGCPQPAPSSPGAQQRGHNCPAVPQPRDREPFQPRVTKPIGMQLHPVPSVSLRPHSPGDLASLCTAGRWGVPAPSTHMSTRLCPVSGGGSGARDSPCPQGQRFKALYREQWLSTREPACDPRAYQDVVTTARGSGQGGPRVQGYRARCDLSSDPIPSRSQPQHKASDTW